MEAFQGHVRLASKILRVFQRPAGKFSPLTHYFLHLPASATGFIFSIYFSFPRCSRPKPSFEQLHEALPAKPQVREGPYATAFLLHLQNAQNHGNNGLPHVLSSFFFTESSHVLPY
jgi:hypothetical protein